MSRTMTVYPLVCSILPIVLMTSSLAVAEPANRNGNVWDGVVHQPTRSIAQEKEGAAGLRSSPRNEINKDDFIERLARQLLKQK